MLKVIQDISSIKIDGDLKSSQIQLLDKELVKHSYFQWNIIRLFKQSLLYSNGRHQSIINEFPSMASEVLKIIEPPSTDHETQLLKYNTKVVFEACILLKTLIKPRQEE